MFVIRSNYIFQNFLPSSYKVTKNRFDQPIVFRSYHSFQNPILFRMSSSSRVTLLLWSSLLAVTLLVSMQLVTCEEDTQGIRLQIHKIPKNQGKREDLGVDAEPLKRLPKSATGPFAGRSIESRSL